MVLVILVIRSGYWFSSSNYLNTRWKQSWIAHFEKLKRSLIKSMQSRRRPEQISAELKLPFCGHRCLLDHCGAKREMNVKIIHDASCFHALFQGSDELTSVLASLKTHPVSEDLFTPISLYSCFCVLSVNKRKRSGGDSFHRIFICATQISIYIIVNSPHFCLK